MTHRATFAILADLRVWFFAAIEPLAPAGLTGHRRGDLLARIVADIDTLEDFYVRVVVPPVVAALVTVFAGLLLGAFDPILGVALFGFLVVSGVVLPLASRRVARRPAVALIGARAELSATVVDEVRGIADLVALDRAADHRERVLALGRTTDRALAELALVRGAGGALAATLAGLAGVTVLALGIELVGAGRLDPVFLALLPLVAVASFEVVGPLAQAVALQDANEAAAERLFELADAPPAVVDPPPDAPSTPGPDRPRHLGQRRPLPLRPGRAGGPRRVQLRGAERDLASRSSGRAARARRRWSTSCSVSGTSTRARSGSAAATSATIRPTTSGGCSASSARTSTCSTRRSATTSRSPTRT